ncbi:MAG: virulence factor [Ornithinimicrobium sp.]
MPGQVVARDGERKHTIALPLRFEKAIHRAAVGRGQAGTAAFVAGWRRESRQCSPDLESEVAATVAQIDSDFDDARLEALITITRSARVPNHPLPHR